MGIRRVGTSTSVSGAVAKTWPKLKAELRRWPTVPASSRRNQMGMGTDAGSKIRPGKKWVDNENCGGTRPVYGPAALLRAKSEKCH